jgi:hypothetical protein
MNMQPKKIATPLSRKATLVSVNVSQWTARRLDRKVTDEVNRQHNAAKDAGRYNKLLIEAEHLKEKQPLGFLSKVPKCSPTSSETNKLCLRCSVT